MPRWASRILLEITDVRVEQLQHITIGQICKEGLARSMYEFIPVTTAFDAFAELWNSTGGDWDPLGLGRRVQEDRAMILLPIAAPLYMVWLIWKGPRP